MDKTCEICGGTFQVKPYRAATARFCSQKCGGVWHQSQRPNMYKPFERGNGLREGLRPTNAFTSEQVAGPANAKWVDVIALVCANCGTEFSCKPWRLRQCENRSGHRFCTDLCRRTFMRGENDPRYVGGPTTYRGRGWLVQRKKAVQRDSGTCQDCGKVVGLSIPVHHRRPFREFENPEEANCLENLICYCQSCHMKHERPAVRHPGGSIPGPSRSR